MTVYLKVNGQLFGGWETVSVKRSLEHISGEFEFSVTEKWPGQDTPRAINKGDLCQVLIDSDIVITGVVDTIKVTYDDKEHTLTIGGMDKSGDLVKSSADLSGPLKGQRVEQIVKALAKAHGIPVSVDVDTNEAFDSFAVMQGEKVHGAINRACRQRSVLCIPDRKGGLIITRAGSRVASDSLKLGGNILKCSFEDSDREKHSKITVKGQTKSSDSQTVDQTTSWSATVTDPSVKRHRPHILVAENQADGNDCHHRATIEKGRRTVKGTKVTYTVQGWRQKSGALWDINTQVFVDDPMCKLHEVMLILDVEYKQDDQGGTITELTVVDKAGYEYATQGSKKHRRGKKSQVVQDQTKVPG